jgi:hypothetical protein
VYSAAPNVLRATATGSQDATAEVTKAAQQKEWAARRISSYTIEAGSPFISWPTSAVVYVATSATVLSHSFSVIPSFYIIL